MNVIGTWNIFAGKELLSSSRSAPITGVGGFVFFKKNVILLFMSKHVELKNARDKEQLARMRRLASKKQCHFCPDGFKEHSAPIIKQSKHWYVTANDFPYKGSVHHFLIVSKKHITRLEKIPIASIHEMHAKIIPWLVKYLNATGYSVFVRSGDMKTTAATLDHIHFHFVVGVRKKKNNHPIIIGPLGYQSGH